MMTEWITSALGQMGYLGIVLLMVAENLFPPIPSELVMPFAGFTAARGDLNIGGVVIAGTLGSIIGALPWYYAGRMVGQDRLERWASRHGRWLTLSPQEVRSVTAWFRRHCGKSVLLGRLVPTVRTLVSIPAGIACMSLTRFLLFTTIGTLAWNGILATSGYFLEARYEQVGGYIDPLAKAVLGLIAITYVYKVITWSPKR
jgi:membrane protein DedA with SNARE-associated domain